MKKRTDDVRRLEAALFEAGRRRGVPEPGADWSRGVMDEIRRIGPLAVTNGGVPFGRVAWRFAAAACIAAIVLLVLVSRSGLIPYGEIAQFIFEDPSGTVFGEPLVL